jgi:hypothetical protein
MDKARGPVFESLGEVHRRRRSRKIPGYAGKGRWAARLLILALAGAGLIVLAVEVGPGLFAPSSSPRLSMLATAGVQRSRGVFQVDSRITLSWASRPKADRYRLQVAIAPKTGRKSDTRIFMHPYLSTIVTQTSYSLRLGSAGAYYWRVQGAMHGSWGAYAPARRLVVVAPVIARPVPLAPRDHSRVGHSARLCWSAVQYANGYEVRITGRSLAITSATCKTLTLRPGTYAWKVAAFVRGTHTYTGRYSWSAHFTVEASPAPARPVQRTVSQAPIAPVPVRTVPVRQAPVLQTPVRPTITQRSSVRPAPVRRSVVRPAPVHRLPVRPTPPPEPPTPAPQRKSPTPSGCIPLYTC